MLENAALQSNVWKIGALVLSKNSNGSVKAFNTTGFTVSDWVPKKDSSNFESNAFL